MKNHILFFIFLGMFCPVFPKFVVANDWLDRSYQAFELADKGHDLTSTKRGEGTWTIRTTGSDPYVQTIGLVEKLDPFTGYRVMFEYQSSTDLRKFQVLYQTLNGLRESNQVLPASVDWRWHSFELGKGEKGLEELVQWLRFDFGDQPGQTFLIKNLRLIKVKREFDPSVLKHLAFSLKAEGHQASVKTLAEGGWAISTEGKDPYVMASEWTGKFEPDAPYVLAFEYQAPPDSSPLVLYFRTDSGVRNQTLETSPTDGWTWHLHDFSVNGGGLGEPLKWARIDFGTEPDVTYRIRNCRLIPASRELRQRVRLGQDFDQLSRFGIGLGGIKPQQTAIETVREKGERGIAVTLSTYRHLDLDAETKRLAKEASSSPPVPLGPRIVAGEGQHPDNHTVVRILSPYQICETQFLAYPSEIRGGVGLETGTDDQEKTFILCYPLVSDRTRELRLFSESGATRGAVAVPEDLLPPFTVSVGDYRTEVSGDEIAIASRYASTANPAVYILSRTGEVLEVLQIPGESEGSNQREFNLFTKTDGKTDQLFVQDLADKLAFRMLSKESTPPVKFTDSPAGSQLFDTAYSDREFNLGLSESVVSTLHRWKRGNLLPALDAGRMENILWFDPQEVHNGSRATWGAFSDGRYIKNSLYNFLGPAQYWSPLVKTGEIEERSFEQWTNGIDWDRSAFGGPHRKSTDDYEQGVPTVWNACFTHRWNIGASKALATQTDPKTLLPRYLLLDRKNEPTGGGYFKKRLFDYGTQNFEQESIDRYYTYAQRAFYRKLAPYYRATPEMTVAVEPNHENEIVSGRNSVGDYNPKSIEGFYQYLLSLYQDLATINNKMGTAFSSDFFDAPRGLLRGDWDRYDSDNLLFREWVEYNRIQVYRRVGASYREALLAGFPPELIKSHQIPDRYVFGSIVGISERDVRISPIDWLLTTGAGFGFSRYGTYYERKHNIGQGAHSSGFDGMLIGEYASLNPSLDKALGQLLYLREHGVSALHVMWWPEDLDRGYNAAQAGALRQMIAKHDKPKPGLAGGIAQVRAWRGGSEPFEIASLGTGSEHTGLLKSLRQDGSFEGSVYVVPFHAQVAVETLNENPSLAIGVNPAKLATARGLRQGAVLETTFRIGKLEKSGTLSLNLLHDGVVLQDASVLLNELEEGQEVRVVHKVPLILEQLSLELVSTSGAGTIENLKVIRHQDQAINLTRNLMEGRRHQGGVTFALLPASRED